ncbi:MAG: VOC family protein [Fidelibacterota bacterium]|jgi:catechol 2,3-dioxygenase-like lactoylglutathione lyase family enzyme|tara:strand:+ start:645 stop:947 length:303 start_codon:yes stop_codon:yes gene_type:complete
MSLTYIDHIAVKSEDIKASVDWYIKKFNCQIKHQDETWALLSFDNISIALVTPGEHPPHFAVIDKSISDNKNLKTHRDGIGYVYESDPDKNIIELLDRRS